MANQWYYSIQNQKYGPVGDSELKRLAAEAKLSESDLIWREGMTEWKQAGAIKGLFKPTTSTSPPPLPSVEKSSGNDSESVSRSEGLTMGLSARLAAKLTAKQAELTKINQMSIPSLLTQLGQLAFEDENNATYHSEVIEKIKNLNDQIASLEKLSNEQPAATTLANKAMQIGEKAVNLAKIKKAELQRKQKFYELGKLLFESKQFPRKCESIQDELEKLNSQADSISSEIATLKSQLTQQGKEVVHRSWALLNSTFVVLSFAFVCAPIGLFLIWRHPTWGKFTKIKWAAASLIFLFAVTLSSKLQIDGAMKELYSANELWQHGNQADAIDKYRNLLLNSWLPTSEKPMVYRRVIEFDCEHNNTEAAKNAIEQSMKKGMQLTLTNPTAKRIENEIKAAKAMELSRHETERSQNNEVTEKKKPLGSPIVLKGEKIEDLIDNPEKYANKILILEATWNASSSLRSSGRTTGGGYSSADGSYVPMEIGGQYISSWGKGRTIATRKISVRIATADIYAEFKSLNSLPDLRSMESCEIKILFDGDFSNCRLLNLKRL